LRRISIICGGSGSSQFARLFGRYSATSGSFEPIFIANVSDNYWYHGLYVCPDVDITTHALSGLLDTSKGWGIASDNYTGKELLSKLGEAEWFGLGDKELSYCVRRTELLKLGWKLSSATEHIAKLLGITFHIYPATDDTLATFVRTNLGSMHLQEFWVKRKAKPILSGVFYEGISEARPHAALSKSAPDFAIVCPANPVTSILPIVGLRGVSKRLAGKRTVAISPFVGNRPFSGPAGKLMLALSIEPSSYGVASLYSQFVKLFIIDKMDDSSVKDRIKDLGMECIAMNTRVGEDSKNDDLARDILSLI
jgi:LPPG:FO 2-phospho-L-lactate transferase